MINYINGIDPKVPRKAQYTNKNADIEATQVGQNRDIE